MQQHHRLTRRDLQVDLVRPRPAQRRRAAGRVRPRSCGAPNRRSSRARTAAPCAASPAPRRRPARHCAHRRRRRPSGAARRSGIRRRRGTPCARRAPDGVRPAAGRAPSRATAATTCAASCPSGCIPSAPRRVRRGSPAPASPSAGMTTPASPAPWRRRPQRPKPRAAPLFEQPHSTGASAFGQAVCRGAAPPFALASRPPVAVLVLLARPAGAGRVARRAAPGRGIVRVHRLRDRPRRRGAVAIGTAS